MLTPSPMRLPSLSSTTSPKWMPDTELDTALRRQASVALDHPILHFDGAAHGVDHASELNEDAISCPLNDAAVMQGDGRVDQVTAPRSRASVRSSSAPASLLYPTTSAARIAASFRVSVMAAAPSREGSLTQFKKWDSEVRYPTNLDLNHSVESVA
jgi:hypothetical protein